MAGPVVVTIVAVFKRPKSMPKKLSKGRIPRPSKPDWDNIGKAVCDALNGIAYDDDAIIVSGSVTKWVAAEGELPHVEIRLQDFSSSP